MASSLTPDQVRCSPIEIFFMFYSPRFSLRVTPRSEYRTIREGGLGVYFGPQSHRNLRGRLLADSPQTSQRVEFMAIFALRQVEIVASEQGSILRYCSFVGYRNRFCI